MIVCIILYIKSQLEKSAIHSSPPFIDGWCRSELSWWSKNLIIHCAPISFTTEGQLPPYNPIGIPFIELAPEEVLGWLVDASSNGRSLLVVLASTVTIWILFFSNRDSTASVHCPLNTSKMASAGHGWLGGKLKSFLFCRHREENPFRCILPLCPRSPNG